MAQLKVYQGHGEDDYGAPCVKMRMEFEFDVNEYMSLNISHSDLEVIRNASKPDAKISEILHAMAIIALYKEAKDEKIRFSGDVSSYEAFISTGALSFDIEKGLVTSVPPKKEGYYWAKAKTGKIMMVEKAWGSGLQIMGSNLSANNEDFALFLGPIEKPEM